MYKKNIIPAMRTVLGARFFKSPRPLITAWAITHRCNRKCCYCSIPQNPCPELSTKQIYKIIDTLAHIQCIRISFTGGEPLLRRDMGAILNYVHAKGMETKLNSNGRLVQSKIKQLKNLDFLTLSLDGPRQIHDAVRGQGSYDEVMQAANMARDHGIKFNFASVLTSINLKAIDFLLNIARQYHCMVIFQPATQNLYGGFVHNPLALNTLQNRKVIKKLLQKKKNKAPIANSLPALTHLGKFPAPAEITCASGQISCRIEPNGDIVYCGRNPKAFQPLNAIQHRFATAFEHLTPIRCSQCWCAQRVELNLAFAGIPAVIKNQIFSKLLLNKKLISDTKC